MKNFNAISCIKIGASELKILVYDLLTKKAIWRRTFTYDFPVFDGSGILISPTQVASFIQNIFKEYKLPKKARVCLSLEYLSVNKLLLPAISGAELHQIIFDEAAHKSDYSFTNEKIAVAYQILKDKINQNGIVNTEVFSVTSLQTVINQLIEVFANTDMVLETISPAFWGLRYYLAQYLNGIHEPIILILAADNDAEFYLWKGRLPYSCHYIKSGSKTVEKLQDEVRRSLEYFNRPVNGEEPLTKIVVAGEKCDLNLGDGYDITYKYAEEWPDLLGLAYIARGRNDLNFLNTIPKPGFALPALVNKFWPVTIGALICLNILSGWNLWSGSRHLAQVKHEYQRQRYLLSIKAQQMSRQNTRPVSFRFNADELFEKIGGLVPEDMMFDQLVLDIEKKSMQVEGFCISQKNLNQFLAALSQIDRVKSVDEVESSQQTRDDFIGYAFRFNIIFRGFPQ